MKISTVLYLLILILISSNVSTAFAQSKEPPLDDKRLSIHTLIREDIFSGWRANNLKRMKRGEANIEKLLKSRPESKADLLAWKGGVALYYAVTALEDKQVKVYEQQLAESRKLFAEAKKADPNSGGVHSVLGGSTAMFADRMAKKDQRAAWEQAYNSFQFLWKNQGSRIKSMPLHIGGELLAGLAVTAQRLGKSEEVTGHLDKIIDVYDGSSYAKEAKLWKSDPQSAQTRNIVCKSCHSPGRLTAKLRRLDSK